MGKLDQRFEEDRRLRDTAKAVLMDDIEHARATFSAKGVADKMGSRIGDGAKDVFSVAKTHADDNRAIIALIIGALLLWLGREPIKEALGIIDEELEKAIEAEEEAADGQEPPCEPDDQEPTESHAESDAGDPDEH